jgi:hypothetical protein
MARSRFRLAGRVRLGTARAPTSGVGVFSTSEHLLDELSQLG